MAPTGTPAVAMRSVMSQLAGSRALNDDRKMAPQPAAGSVTGFVIAPQSVARTV
jgi:hypothetical protein